MFFFAMSHSDNRGQNIIAVFEISAIFYKTYQKIVLYPIKPPPPPYNVVGMYVRYAGAMASALKQNSFLSIV